jgi:hypothetical protein
MSYNQLHEKVSQHTQYALEGMEQERQEDNGREQEEIQKQVIEDNEKNVGRGLKINMNTQWPAREMFTSSRININTHWPAKGKGHEINMNTQWPAREMFTSSRININTQWPAKGKGLKINMNTQWPAREMFTSSSILQYFKRINIHTHWPAKGRELKINMNAQWLLNSQMGVGHESNKNVQILLPLKSENLSQH